MNRQKHEEPIQERPLKTTYTQPSSPSMRTPMIPTYSLRRSFDRRSELALIWGPYKNSTSWALIPEPWEDPKNGSTRKGSVIYTVGVSDFRLGLLCFLDPPGLCDRITRRIRAQNMQFFFQTSPSQNRVGPARALRVNGAFYASRRRKGNTRGRELEERRAWGGGLDDRPR